MPQGDTDSYKEMYEMGERLMQMAKDGGYDPSESDYTDSEESEKPVMGADSDKIKTALGMFGNG